MIRLAAIALMAALGACTADPGPQPHAVVAFIPNEEAPRCSVLRVVDGDTVEIGCQSGDLGNVRLVGFVTPETFRPGCRREAEAGARATAYLMRVLRGATQIELVIEGTDRYQRPLVRLNVDGRDLADVMVGAGYAVRYTGGRRIDWCTALTT